MRIVSKLLSVVVMGTIAVLAISPLAAVFVDSGLSNAVFLTLLAIIIVVATMSENGRRAWGWGSIICGCLFLALPIATAVLSGKVTNQMVAEAAAQDASMTAAGATIGSGLLVGASAFFGFFLALIFIVLGLVLTLGGRKEVVVVEKL